jgi:hypothetical protein
MRSPDTLQRSEHSTQATLSRTRTWAAIIVTVSLFVRLLHCAAISDSGFLKFPIYYEQSDMFAFWEWAQRIAAGDWLGRDTYHPYFDWMKQLGPLDQWYQWWGGKNIFHQAPIYPYFLAMLLTFTHSLTAVTCTQLVLGSFQPLVLFFLARRLFQDDRVAVISGLLAALYGPFVFFQGAILRDWLLPMVEPFILLMILRALDRKSLGAWLVAGVVMGVAALVKETTLALSGLALLWTLFQFRTSWRQAARPFALVSLGVLLGLSPLIIRNAVVGAPLLAISVQGAGNLIVGLNPAEAAAGQVTKPSDLSRMISQRSGSSALAALRELLYEYRGDYSPLIHHELQKVRALIDPAEVADNLSYSYGQELSPILRFLPTYGLIFPLGAAGLLILLFRRPAVSLLFIYLSAACAVQLVTFVVARFRLSLVPVLLLGASYVLVHAWEHYRATRLWHLAAITGGVMAITAVQQWVMPIVGPSHDLRLAEYLHAAEAYSVEGRYALAVDEVARFRIRAASSAAHALQVDVASALESDYQLQWAEALLALNDAAAARTHLLAAEKAFARQTSFADLPYSLAVIYLQLGESDHAASLFRQFLARAPNDPLAEDARYKLKELSPVEGRR